MRKAALYRAAKGGIYEKEKYLNPQFEELVSGFNFLEYLYYRGLMWP
jgi:hypothetical protein